MNLDVRSWENSDYYLSGLIGKVKASLSTCGLDRVHTPSASRCRNEKRARILANRARKRARKNDILLKEQKKSEVHE